MDFKDYRKSPQPPRPEEETPRARSLRGRNYTDYIDEQIREAQERGEFDNLQGSGKPLHLTSNPLAGDKAMGYSLLKSNGFAPAEVELAREIREEYAKAQAKLDRLRQRGQALRTRSIPPFASEKRIFNASLEETAAQYERTLRELNRKILTLNLTAPAPMHQALFEIEKMVQDFRASCPRIP